MAGKKGHKKRFWSDDEKREICRQARLAGVCVAQVARRYSMNGKRGHNQTRNQIHAVCKCFLELV
jgi:transposase